MRIATFPFAKRMMIEVDPGPPTFELLGRPIGGAKPAAPTAACLTGPRIMAAGDGARRDRSW